MDLALTHFRAGERQNCAYLRQTASKGTAFNSGLSTIFLTPSLTSVLLDEFFLEVLEFALAEHFVGFSGPFAE